MVFFVVNTSIINVCLFVFAGVTEEQFKETWTRPGAVNMGEGTNIVVAKARM